MLAPNEMGGNLFLNVFFICQLNNFYYEQTLSKMPFKTFISENIELISHYLIYVWL